MKTAILLIALTMFSGASWAADYICEKPDGTISLLYYRESANKGLDRFIEDNGCKGLKVKRVTDPSIYPKDKKDRKHWRLDEFDPRNPKISIDAIAKQTDIDAEVAKQSKKTAVLGKLKITDKELKDILGV